MFNIGPLELLVIVVVALVFVGPKQLPEMMKQAGKLFVKVRRTASEVRSGFDDVVRQAEDELRQEEAKSFQKTLLAASSSPTAETHDQAGALGAKPFVPGQASGPAPLPADDRAAAALGETAASTPHAAPDSAANKVPSP